MQCSLDDVPGEEVAMVTFTEQPPVGVVEPDDCCGGSLTSKPEVPPEGVEDTSSDDHCGNALTCPSIHGVNVLWLDPRTVDAEDRPLWTDVAPCSPATKADWMPGKQLEEILCTKGQVFYPQILLPRLYCAPVMEQVHGGHFEMERTLEHLKTRYLWYNMKDDVTLWCHTSCAAKARPKKTPQAAMGIVQVSAPMERFAVDLMGPLNKTEA